MKRIAGMALLMVIAFSAVACTEKTSATDKEARTEISKEKTAKEASSVSASVESGTKEQPSNDNKVADNSVEEKPQEYSNKEKEWRNYQLVDSESSIPGYLNLEIDYSIGKVQLQHQYYNENTYSSENWPLADGLIDVAEYDPMGGPPTVWKEYIEYSAEVIKLHYVDNEGVVDMENYQEFKLVY
jgi:hypothetical protein